LIFDLISKIRYKIVITKYKIEIRGEEQTWSITWLVHNSIWLVWSWFLELILKD